MINFGGEPILTGLDLEVRRGRSLAVVGRSGSGKSTLLSCILGLRKPDHGSIRVGDEPMEAGRASAARLRRTSIGTVFQGGELIPELTPLDNVIVAGLLGGLAVGEATTRAESLLRQLDVPQRSQMTATFSGGERQRVAVARALINKPALVLADEPTASLDDESKAQVINLLHALPTSFDCSLVVVTHDATVAASCDQIARLMDGRLELQQGSRL